MCGIAGIFSHNLKDFGESKRFGIRAVTPAALVTEEYLRERAERGSRRKFEAVLRKVR